jgi:hypothetical protein
LLNRAQLTQYEQERQRRLQSLLGAIAITRARLSRRRSWG